MLNFQYRQRNSKTMARNLNFALLLGHPIREIIFSFLVLRRTWNLIRFNFCVNFYPRLTGAVYIMCCLTQHLVECGIKTGELPQHEYKRMCIILSEGTVLVYKAWIRTY
jgi:hypothetical protein